MAVDMTYFAQMEEKIPRGKVRTRFAPSPTGSIWNSCRKLPRRSRSDFRFLSALQGGRIAEKQPWAER